MNRFFFFSICLLLSALLQGTIIAVDIAGTGDYQSIQAGIDVSTDGDTILVYPGRYYENIDFNGKNISLGSMEMLTGHRDYIHNTIIDGNQTSSCVAVHNNEAEGTILRGFTITNGVGFMYEGWRLGGGIFLYDANLNIVNCIVEYNEARSGGGIDILDAWAYLEGVTIRNNDAAFSGGGIYSGCLPASITYSYENRCNIYDNFSIRGLDFCNRIESGMVTDVVVDTFTVYDPWSYEFYQGEDGDGQVYDESVFDMQHAKYERVYTDLYVSSDGDDENSGISSEEPLQTINHALHFITADEDNPLTIHLADGIYSTELNDQKFPINPRSFVSIIGESKENTIIELNGIDQGFVVDQLSNLGYEIKNLTISDGYANIMSNMFSRVFSLDGGYSNNEVILENLRITNNNFNQVVMISTINLIMRNVTFDNNVHYPASSVFRNYINSHDFDYKVLVENCMFNNNYAGEIFLDSAMSNQREHNFNIVNCEFKDNEYHNNFTDFSVGISVYCIDLYDLNIINCTFADNIFSGVFVENAPVKLFCDIEAEIINSIIYDNDTSRSIILESDPYHGFPVVDVHHSIIEDGLAGVYIDDYGVLNWDEDTVFDADPLFMHEGDYPYQLLEDSPAIDAGSLVLPEGVELPEYDLAGNQRIRGSSVDMGAYEYNPYSSPVLDDVIEVNHDLRIYPNPVHGSRRSGKAEILWLGELLDNMSFEIFNIKGQRLRKLKIENVKNTPITWDLCDEAGDKVSSGVYFVRVKTGNEYIAQQKLTVVK